MIVTEVAWVLDHQHRYALQLRELTRRDLVKRVVLHVERA
jgi:hypothetical protein